VAGFEVQDSPFKNEVEFTRIYSNVVECGRMDGAGSKMRDGNHIDRVWLRNHCKLVQSTANCCNFPGGSLGDEQEKTEEA
jgi:hypothetical protein